MFAITGADPVSGGISAPVATIMGLFSLTGIIASTMLNRRGKRRTEPAPSPPDVLASHKRIDTVEQNVADLRRTIDLHIASSGANDFETERRLDRIEDRVWPRANPPT